MNNPLEDALPETVVGKLSDVAIITLLVGSADDLGYANPMDKTRWKSIPRPKVAALAVGGFSSSHPGGSQFAVGDGSIRFISDSLDPATYGTMANRADGSLVAGDF
jgi:hypothetical protein